MSRPPTTVDELAGRVVAGEARAIARAISLCEEGQAEGLVAALYPRAGRALVVGVTGPPGAGKSTLVHQLARAYLRRGWKVGVVAVDPTSPSSGGALLGDRIRMQDLAADPGMFIRSMATRGVMGGLAAATADAVDVLDAAGKEVILVETVGVGQDEVDIAGVADVVALLFVPGLGDGIQAIKAGLVEVADLYVVNKADLPGVERVERDLELVRRMAEGDGQAAPPIVRTVAASGSGVDALVAEIDGLAGRLRAGQGMADRRRRRAVARVRAIARGRWLARLEDVLGVEPTGPPLDDVVERRIDPYTLAGRLLERMNGC